MLVMPCASPLFEEFVSNQLDALKLSLLDEHAKAIQVERKKCEQPIVSQHTSEWHQVEQKQCEQPIVSQHRSEWHNDEKEQRRSKMRVSSELGEAVQGSEPVHHGIQNLHRTWNPQNGGEVAAAELSTDETLESMPQKQNEIERLSGISKNSRKTFKSASSVVSEAVGQATQKAEVIAADAMNSSPSRFVMLYERSRYAESWSQRLVSGYWFDSVSGLVVFLQSLLIGVEIEIEAINGDANALLTVQIGSHVLVGLTLMEFLFRVNADGLRTNRGWNLFDLMILILSFADMFFAVADSSMKVLRLIRLCKVARVLRWGRLIRNAESFVKMAYCIMHSLPPFFPAITLIVTIIFALSIVLTQLTIEHLREPNGKYDAFKEEEVPEGQSTTLRQAYGTLMVSIYSLGKSISNGVSWGEMLEPLTAMHWTVPFLFVSFVSFNLLCVMNVVMSVFVEGAIDTTKHFKELVVQQKRKAKSLLLSQLRNIFHEIDVDGSGEISVDEIEFFLQSEGGRAFFDVVGLGRADAITLMLLLDEDLSGCVDIDEFCEGCLTCQGEATSFDMHCLFKESRISWLKISSLCEVVSNVEELSSELVAKVNSLLGISQDVESPEQLEPEHLRKLPWKNRMTTLYGRR